MNVWPVQCSTYNTYVRVSDVCRGSNILWTRTPDRETLHMGRLPSMCGHHNVRAITGQDTTKDINPDPGYKIKLLIPSGIEPGPLNSKARHGNGLISYTNFEKVPCALDFEVNQ